MNKTELLELVEKLKAKSQKYYIKSCEDYCFTEKASFYDRAAGQLEDTIENYIDNEDYTTEEEVIEDIKNLFDEVDNFYDEEDYENMGMLDDFADDRI